MDTVFGLVALGILIMIALFFAQLFFTFLVMVVMLPVVGFNALRQRIKK